MTAHAPYLVANGELKVPRRYLNIELLDTWKEP